MKRGRRAAGRDTPGLAHDVRTTVHDERLAAVCDSVPRQSGQRRAQRRRAVDHRVRPSAARSDRLEPSSARAVQRVAPRRRTPCATSRSGQSRDVRTRPGRAAAPDRRDQARRAAAFTWSVSTSRMRRQVRRDDGPPGGEVVEQLQRRRVAVGDRAAHVGQRQHVTRGASAAATSGGRQPPGELHAVATPRAWPAPCEPDAVTLRRAAPATTSPRTPAAGRKRLDEARPRLSMDTGDPAYPTVGGSGRRRPGERAGRVADASVGHDGGVARARSASSSFAAMRARQRDVAADASPHATLTCAPAAGVSPRGRGACRAERGQLGG